MALYVPLALALSGLAYGLLRADANVRLQRLQVQEASEANVSAQLLGHDFEDARSDLQFLSKAPALKRFLNDNNQAEKLRLTEHFRNIAEAKARYDQIRYIDSRGMEIIRINRTANGVETVPAGALQNKAGRYFFKETLKLGEGEIYISPLDLNVEHGQIEQPYKPTLRFGTPVFNQAGKKQGILLLNYNGRELLDDFVQAMAEGLHAMLLNRDGYWLSSPDPAREWGFMFGRDDSFGKSYPDEWARISVQQQGNLLSQHGLFSFTTVYPLLSGQRVNAADENDISARREYYWKIVSLVLPAEIPAVTATQYPRSFALLGLGLILLALFAVYLATILLGRRQLLSTIVENKEHLKEITSTLAEGIYVIDKQGMTTFVNPEAERLLGWSRDELVGRHAHNQFHYRSLDGAPIRAEDCDMYDVIHTGKTYRSNTQVFWRKDGSYLHVDVSASPILRDGKTAGAVVAFSDFSERKRLEAEETLLHHIDQQVLRSHSLSGLLQFICNEMVELFDYPIAWLGKKEAGGAFSISAQSGNVEGYLPALLQNGVCWDDTPQGKGPAGACIRSGQIQVFKISETNFRPWHDADLGFDFEAIAGIPLIVRGQVYGALMLYSRHEHDFDDVATIQRLSGVAGRICVALEMAMNQEQLRLLSSALASAGNGIFISDPAGRILWVNSSFTRLTGYSAEEAIGQSPSLLKSGKQDASYYEKLWKTILQGNTWSDEVVERRKNGTLITVQQTITPIQNEEGKVTHFISILDDITAQKEAAARIQYMAHFDALTSLPNRTLFRDRLRQALAQAKRDGLICALMFIDLDEFKAVNDTLGHHIGDLLLQAAAKRLTACVRETDTVSRLGGDEFTVLLPHVHGSRDAALVAEKITSALARPFLLDGHEVNIGSSIGIAFYPADADSDEALIICADSAMYAAKDEGRGAFRFFDMPAS